MAEKVSLELVTPERLLLAKQVDMVVLPGTEGRIGVLPGHAPMIISLRPGTVDVYENAEKVDRLFVGGGFAEISGQGCIVLAETALSVADIDRDEVSRLVETLSQSVGGQIPTPDADPASPLGELAMRLSMLEATEGKAVQRASA